MKKLTALVMVLCMVFASVTALAEISVLATGDVHMRATPSLDGEKRATLKNGRELPFGYETSVDDRGVIWYLAGNGDEWVWVSSRYSVLTDGATEGMDFTAEQRGAGYTVLSDDTLAVDPVKWIGAIDLAEGSVVTATGLSYTGTDEHTALLVEDADGNTGWVDTLNVAPVTAEE